MAGPHHHGHAHFHRHVDAGHRVSVEHVARAVPVTEARMASPAQGIEQPTGPLTARGVGDKPIGPDVTNIAIACGIAIPMVLAISVLLFLHRRSVKRQRLEDADDKYKSMDFGLGEGVGGSKNGKRRSNFFGKEKDSAHKTQLSMDMNLSSPYLLPPTLQHSRESLARSLNKDESDPYRLVPDYASEVGSMRSFPNKRPDRGSSIYSGKTGATRPSTDAPQSNFPLRQNSLPPPTSPLPQLPAAAQRAEIVGSATAPELPAKNEFRFNDDESSRPQGASQTIPEEGVPEIQQPPQAATKSSARVVSGQSASSVQQQYESRAAYDRESGPLPPRDPSRGQGLGITDATPYPSDNNMPVIVTETQPASSGFDFNLNTSSPQLGGGLRSQEQDEAYPQEHDYPHSAGLAVPEQANKRLSVGFRPLPPDDYLESEDPEFRANRIRSFYKEYFDDSIKQDSGKPPPLPNQNGGPAHGSQEPAYYEDYDANYMGGEAAYFDPETNAFVMPYAQPVTRRAMTPPPNNRRPMPGPRGGGPHRGPPMMPGGGPGRPRAGSTMSGAMGRPRAGSTMSGGRFGPNGSGYMSPRPGSSASQQRSVNGGKPRKPMPPPAALTTLPTPSKLKDDSFSIFNAADFAPPPNIRDQARGRSQSPLGERRPYHSPSVPVHSPLVSSYDEVAALPSPHLLRKSSTFTGLDFAPPRRFKDPDTMSDAGSIRSNNSGISSKNAIALRNGAGRVSRLPGDTVFTQHEMAATLRPQMDMINRS
ncbi:uncharacterized protein B0I36DRAFT_14991 [Microdochium trichocladiopsis]|uniref:Uncharacterized protein n=1 Tax=Microdochium trichocladiopsis TaxID=1682393 RepID=A0A9P8YFE2_9PEZI|nr:uncharacterized protein B0I36DRAFT_14991 [Microdochium trichocladiopsis]KAH7040757.1 hypothetical protein B0I36DRAFT_14991 [Microdochium trichocladiopsis]